MREDENLKRGKVKFLRKQYFAHLQEFRLSLLLPPKPVLIFKLLVFIVQVIWSNQEYKLPEGRQQSTGQHQHQ